MPKQKILLLITKADVGGAQIHVLEILKRLGHCYDFVLALGEDDFLSREARKLGIEVHILKQLKRPIQLSRDRRAYLECVALLKQIQPDLLHTHSSKAGVIGRLAARRLNVASVFTAHGWAFTQGAPRIQRLYGLLLESILCRLPATVITISEYDFQLAARFHVGWPEQRYLIRNGVSRPELPAPADAKEQKILHILTVGRLSPVKNHRMLVSALAQLTVPFRARIVGEGECHAQIQAEIDAQGLTDQIMLQGEVIELAEHLAWADVFVLSSNYEGLPLSVLEAMSVGLPVVSTHVGGVPEAVLAQQSGLLSPRGDASALAENIDRLCRSAELRAQYGARGRQHYEQNFTAARMIEEIDQLYRRLLDQ